MASGLIAVMADQPIDSLRQALGATRLEWVDVYRMPGHGSPPVPR
jgi:hypothetical protein